jgi:hypothetical protein
MSAVSAIAASFLTGASGGTTTGGLIPATAAGTSMPSSVIPPTGLDALATMDAAEEEGSPLVVVAAPVVGTVDAVSGTIDTAADHHNHDDRAEGNDEAADGNVASVSSASISDDSVIEYQVHQHLLS